MTKTQMMRSQELDYMTTEFPLAAELFNEARLAAYNTMTADRSVHRHTIDRALNAAMEYGALRCLARLLRVDADKLVEDFMADDLEDSDPDDEDDSDRRLSV